MSRYGVGMVFGPQDLAPAPRRGYPGHWPGLRARASKRGAFGAKCDKVLEDSINYYGMKVLGRRNVPTSNDCLGPIALEAEPTIKTT
jgi:glutamate synthase domain-containing protein 1